MSKYDVTVDREKFVGGSDIPVIMGISPFKTRYELLLEKAGIQESDFEGNRYTEYGDALEPKIRAYINEKHKTNYKPNQTIEGDLRGNTDGFNGKSVLEIKTTSRVYETLDEYIVYLVQVLFYLERNKVEEGLLAVYERPADFDLEFDPSRLQEFAIFRKDHLPLVQKINAEIDRFRFDLARLKENPLLSEQDFIAKDLVTLSNKVVQLEAKMAEFKEFEKQYKAMKTSLYEAMVTADVKTWVMPNGTRITRVDAIPSSVKMVEEFDLAKFKKENPQLAKRYITEVGKETSGRAGYALITIPKE